MSIHNNPSNRSSIFYCSGYSRGKEWEFYEGVVQIQTAGKKHIIIYTWIFENRVGKKKINPFYNLAI